MAIRRCPTVTKARVKRGYVSIVMKCAFTPVSEWPEPFKVMLANWCDKVNAWCTASEKKDVEAIREWHGLV